MLAPGEPEYLKEAIGEADLLINCTSVGMWPNVDAIPCPEDLLHSRLLVYDLVYNPLETRLIRAAAKAGATAISGLKMLVYQGSAAFEMWTGCQPSVETMENAAISEISGWK